MPSPNYSRAMTEDPDAIDALLAAAQRGEREAMHHLVTRYYDRVQREVHRRLQSRFGNSKRYVASVFSTGDIVQEVFLRVLERPFQLVRPNEEMLLGYLITTVHNHILDTMRFHYADRRDARRKLASRDDELPDPVAAVPAGCTTPSREAEAGESTAIYAAVLDSFPPREQQLLRRRLELDTPFEELARLLGYKSADVARKSFHTAKARLLQRLRARGVDGGRPA